MKIRDRKNGHNTIGFIFHLGRVEFVLELVDIIRVIPIIIVLWAYATYWLIPNRNDLDYLKKNDSIQQIFLATIKERFEKEDKEQELQHKIDSLEQLRGTNEIVIIPHNDKKTKNKNYNYDSYYNELDSRIRELELTRQRRKNY